MPVIANDDMLLTSLTAPWIDIFVVTRAESIFNPVALHCTTMKICSSQCMRLDPASVLGSREHMRSDVRTIAVRIRVLFSRPGLVSWPPCF